MELTILSYIRNAKWKMTPQKNKNDIFKRWLLSRINKIMLLRKPAIKTQIIRSIGDHDLNMVVGHSVLMN